MSPGIGELIPLNFIPISEKLRRWVEEPHEKNNKYPEHLIHKALSGNHVRSKSEVLIDMFLCKNKIPFRYECLLQLGAISLYPDFTIRHPITGKEFYWEHLGRMDDPGYSNNACLKLQTYMANGIIPNINLIITCETKECPLDPEMVEKIIEYFFL